MKTRMRLISILLAVAMTAALLPMLGLAAAAEDYGLRVQDVDVTDENKADILQNESYSPSDKYPERTAAYDIETNTLKMAGSFGAPGGSLRSWINGLTVSIEKDTYFGGGHDDIVSLGSSTTFTGPGILRIACAGESDSCISAGGQLVLDGITLMLTGSSGIRGYSSPALIISNSYILSEGTISGFTGGIVLDGCEIFYPVGAYIKDGAIVAADGSLADNIIISPKTAVEYALYVEDVGVTGENKDDILADVTYSPSAEYPERIAAYDSVSDTLTMGGRFGAPGGSLRSWIGGLTVDFTKDTFLSGGYDDIVTLNAATTFRGPGNISIACGASSGTCIFVGESLVLDGVTLELTGSTGMRGYPSPALTIKDSYIRSEGTISGFSGGI
ncbi:MAG: hypothetical protein J5822_08755, partial [Eubacteriaceae bacterium]|nr:hypothetical protein [Eubacteriaceae bacterium]